MTRENLSFFVTTTPGCNAIFAVRIWDQVADIHISMLWICISANNDSPVVFPSLAHAVKILHGRRRASFFPEPGTLPQDMVTLVNGHDVGRERHSLIIALREHLFNILNIVCQGRVGNGCVFVCATCAATAAAATWQWQFLTPAATFACSFALRSSCRGQGYPRSFLCTPHAEILVTWPPIFLASSHCGFVTWAIF